MTDPFDLTGTVAVVSGASGRLGPAMVRTLTTAGAEVVAVARSRERLDEVFASDAGVTLESCDVTSPAWPELLESIGARFGRLDVLVNNAHVGRGGSLRLAGPGDYAEAFDLAVTSTATGISAARELLAASVRDGGPGAVVNVSSMYGVVAPDPSMYDTEEGRNPPYYGAAKAAMLQLTRYAAAELGPLGIRVNALLLGPFPGESADEAAAALHQRIAARTMLGRLGSPDDVAGALLFLASRASAFVTGATVPVDGGWTAW